MRKKSENCAQKESPLSQVRGTIPQVPRKGQAFFSFFRQSLSTLAKKSIHFAARMGFAHTVRYVQSVFSYAHVVRKNNQVHLPPAGGKKIPAI
ncbi:MAG: hypothetical protein IJV64_08790 [Oscillospiraceae bacterium]|nr:hypothetical protein [Oscillospiraceae bacterium]